MKHCSCGTVSTLLCIFLVLFLSLVSAQLDGQASNKNCPSTPNPPWWRSLLDSRERDPCVLAHTFFSQTFCCFKGSGMHMGHGKHDGGGGGHHDNDSQPERACGACNLQTYNIVSACIACNFLPTASEEAMEGLGNISGVAQLQSWTKNNQGSNTFNADVPPWASAPLDPQQTFSAKLVLQAAHSNLNSSSTSSQTPTSSTSMSDSASSTPKQVSPPKSLASNTMHVGTIVAGVVGGIAFLTITAVGGFCFMRYRERRRKLSYAPSNEFTSVRPGYSVSPEPPPFSPGAWRDPVLEKAHGAAAMQRDLDTGVYAGETSWRYDLEKI